MPWDLVKHINLSETELSWFSFEIINTGFDKLLY